MSLFLPISVLAQDSIFPSAKVIESDKISGWSSLVDAIQTHRSLLKFLKFRVSGAVEVLSTATGINPRNVPGPNGDQLVLGAIHGCKVELTEQDILATNLHEYAHTIFSPNFRDHFNYTSISYAEEPMLGNKIARATPKALSYSFNELFADTYAVLAIEDPEAIETAMAKCEHEEPMRSFAKDYPLKNWDRGSLIPIFSVHRTLSPTRNEIWRSYKSLEARGDKEPKARILSAVYEASIASMENILARELTYSQWFEFNQEELNRLVIKEFLKRLE